MLAKTFSEIIGNIHIAKTFSEILKMNDAHDELGRFTTKGSTSSTERSNVEIPDGDGKVTIDEKRAKHIFRESSGHFKDDTPENRKLLESIANKKENYLGRDAKDNDWFDEIIEELGQVWDKVRNRKIINGGVNKEPRKFNPITGLDSPEKPKQKNNKKRGDD